jgi:hypothetical protein
LSQDEALDVSDVDLATVAHPFLTGFEAEPFAHKVSVPASTAPGPYWLILETDSFNAVQESNELNNTGAIALSVVPQCSVDSFEPNDILGTSSPWAPAVGEPGAADLAICPEDVDWFSVAVPAGIAMTAAISFSQAEGDLDLRLYDPTFSITQPIASSLSSTDNESLQYTPATGADLLLRVNGFDGASAAYGLSISLN